MRPRTAANVWRFLLFGLLALQAGGLLSSQGLPSAEVSLPLHELQDPLHDVILPRLYSVIAADVSPSLGDATLINRFRFIVSLAMVDAAAPYHPTAVGMYTRLPRRPQAEWTNANINTAMMYGAFNALMGLLPEREPVWREMMIDFGLDPEDNSADPATAAGIGNMAGIGANLARLHDGINQTGDYQDTTGYAPVNSAFALRDPARWQPGLRRRGIGVYTVQQFVTPQLANMEPMAPFDPRQFRVGPPAASYAVDTDAYQVQVDIVLETSANLTDEQKLKAELFDNKVASLGLSYIKIADDMGLSPADIARGYLLKVGAWMDASIVTWQEKARYDAVRPFSAVTHVYGDDLVTAWGGPGQGRAEIPAEQWQAYLPENDHSEYPSGSTCGCYAHAQALRRFSGSDALDWSVAYPAGTSRIEPGVTPATDMTLTFNTWTEFAGDCGQSRHWGGVHFVPAVEASAASCSVFGDMAYEYYLTLMDGTAPLREAAQALPPDPWLPARSQPPQPAQTVPENTTPTPIACEEVSGSITVTAVNNGVRCKGVDTSGLSLLAGFIDGATISGGLDLGAQVCFRSTGSLIFLDMSGASPRIEELISYRLADRTCGWIDQPGAVVLIASAQPEAQAAGDVAVPVAPLSQCQVATTHGVNFRAEPAGQSLGTVIPLGARLAAVAKSAGWFNVRYEGASGWISADYVQTSGSC